MRRIKNTSFALFLLIIFCSLLFRISFLDSIEFKADEAINLYLTERPLFGYSFAQGGTASSVGILNPPLFNYLLFPFVLLSKDPRVASFFIGLLNGLSIGFFFLIIKKYFRTKIAIISSLFFAFSPWMTIYSRKIWPQDLISPLTILLIYSLFKILFENKIKFWFLYVLTTAILLQLHQSSIFFIVLLNLYLFIKRTKVNLRYAGMGLAVGLLPLIPFFMFEIQNNFIGLSSIGGLKNQLTQGLSLDYFLRPAQIVGQGNFYFILGNDYPNFLAFAPFFNPLRYIFYLEYIAIPLGAFFFWKRHKTYRFLVYITLLTPIIYAFFRLAPFMHYYIITSPFLFLFLGFCFAYLGNAKNILVKISSLVLCFLLLISSFLFDISFLRFVEHKKALDGDYGSSYIVSKTIAEKTFAKYKDTSDYEDIILSSYIPKYLVHGSLPLAHMLYPYEETTKNFREIEQKLLRYPDDPRIQNTLIAYYTYQVPTSRTIAQLRSKLKKHTQYYDVYNEVYGYYLALNNKKVKKINSFAFEYPIHWKTVKYTKDVFALEGDGYYMEVIPRQDTSEIFVRIIPIENIKLNEKQSEHTLKTIHSVINSFRLE